MRYYFAGVDTPGVLEMIAKAGGRFLFSFANVDPKKMKLFAADMTFLDSGAFSAATQGITLTLDKYIKFVIEQKIKHYANLDVIGNHKKTRENLIALESNGLKPLPVFHFGCDEHLINWYLDRYDHIAIGGLVPLLRQRNKLYSFLDFIFKKTVNSGRLVKFHGFGMGAWHMMNRYPFYSVDSTGWFRNAVLAYPHFARKSIARVIRRSQPQPIYLKYQVREYLSRQITATNFWKQRGIEWE